MSLDLRLIFFIWSNYLVNVKQLWLLKILKIQATLGAGSFEILWELCCLSKKGAMVNFDSKTSITLTILDYWLLTSAKAYLLAQP